MRKYFLLASTAVFLSANVANAQVVMDGGRVTLDVYAGVKSLGVSIDEADGKQNISFGKTIVDKSKHTVREPLVAMDPSDGQLYGGPGFVAHDFTHTFGSFRINGVTEDIMNQYDSFIVFPGVGTHAIQAGSGGASIHYKDGVSLLCHTTGPGAMPEVIYEPTYELMPVEHEDSSYVVIGGSLHVGELDSQFTEIDCEGQLEVMVGIDEI